MYLLYDLVFLFYALVYLPYLLLTQRGYVGFQMRFGIFSPPLINQIKAKANIWLHAVSVGEVMVLDSFIDQLRKDHPSYQLVTTITTKTGYTLACERLKGRAVVLPSPLDFSLVARRFVSLIKPVMYIAVETEIWPNLYRMLAYKKIPLAVINGRISDNSFGRYKSVRFLLKNVLNQVSVWCMQSRKDAERIIDLGADASRVLVTGNIKFDDVSQAAPAAAAAGLTKGKDELWWVAGSTHPGEEEILLNIYAKIIKDDPKWRLVIAPRHIERVPQVLQLAQHRNLTARRLSQGPAASRGGPHHVIVVDVIGQLRPLYAQASLVFVGKSLCVGGGQNVIEPAFYGKAIVVGPRVENFRDIIACFKEGGAIVQVVDIPSFEAAVRGLCTDAAKREALGSAALKVIAANQGAARRSLEKLAGFLK
jgi:3-deoxy-D-manno-octulosonic-acid transferase